MVEARVNYMIATWSGARFLRNHSHHCLDKHLKQLNLLKHDLSQVTIGYPNNPDDSDEYIDYMSSLVELEDGTPIVVMPMVNDGLSYGQWSRIFNNYRDEFSHYILIEDDYVPVIDDFDQELMDMFEEDEECGFVCGLYANKGDNIGHGACHTAHSAIANGISSHEALSKAYVRNGLYRTGAPDANHQVRFSKKFVEAGYTIKDYLHKYRCLYWPHCQKFRMYWDGTHIDDIIVPIQFLEIGDDWEFEKYCRKNGRMKPYIPKPAKEIPPHVKRQLTSARATREDLRRALLAQRRAKRQRDQS